MIKIIALGSDPEFFLIDKETGLPVSSEGLIGGSKDEPLSLSDKGHYAQEDNVMVEINIPPCRDENRFVNEINECINLVKQKINNNLDIFINPSLEFDEKQLSTIQACTVGCDPDYNVYKRMENTAILLNSNMRYAGGHIHVSYENPTIENTERIVKMMDLFLGVPSVIMDKDDIRKSIYGTAGRFRIKKYGLEYRTLSNYWIKNETLIKWVFNQTLLAVSNADEENFKKYEKLSEEVVNIINNNDKKLANKLCLNLNINILQNDIIQVFKETF